MSNKQVTFLLVVVAIFIICLSFVITYSLADTSIEEVVTKVRIEGYLDSNSMLVVTSIKLQTGRGNVQSMDPRGVQVLIQGINLTAKQGSQ